MIKFLFSIVAVAGLCSCGRLSPADEVAAGRIERIFALKERVDSIWPGFGAPEYDVPMVYYTDSLCYAVNPGERFLEKYRPRPVEGQRAFRLYRMELIDTLPFHMEGSVEFSDSTVFNWREPVLLCSSPEVVVRTIGDLKGEDDWSQMVIHEYFHGFQLRHRAFFDWFARRCLTENLADLRHAYATFDWFRESVRAENQLLLDALSAADSRPRLGEYVALREARYERCGAESGMENLPEVERIFETMEGTARYVEFYVTPASYDLSKDEWLTSAMGTNYCYATGFNIARLLDALSPGYKQRLFKEDGVALYDILREACGPVPHQ